MLFQKKTSVCENDPSPKNSIMSVKQTMLSFKPQWQLLTEAALSCLM